MRLISGKCAESPPRTGRKKKQQDKKTVPHRQFSEKMVRCSQQRRIRHKTRYAFFIFFRRFPELLPKMTGYPRGPQRNPLSCVTCDKRDKYPNENNREPPFRCPHLLQDLLHVMGTIIGNLLEAVDYIQRSDLGRRYVICICVIRGRFCHANESKGD